MCGNQPLKDTQVKLWNKHIGRLINGFSSQNDWNDCPRLAIDILSHLNNALDIVGNKEEPVKGFKIYRR